MPHGPPQIQDVPERTAHGLHAAAFPHSSPSTRYSCSRACRQVPEPPHNATKYGKGQTPHHAGPATYCARHCLLHHRHHRVPPVYPRHVTVPEAPALVPQVHRSLERRPQSRQAGSAATPRRDGLTQVPPCAPQVHVAGLYIACNSHHTAKAPYDLPRACQAHRADSSCHQEAGSDAVSGCL